MVFKMEFEKSDSGIYMMDMEHPDKYDNKYTTDIFCIRRDATKPGPTDTHHTLKLLNHCGQVIGVDLIW